MHRIPSITLFLSDHCPFLTSHITIPRGTPLIPDTNGRVTRASEVSLFQGLNCTQELFLGKEEFSLLERCPHFRSVKGVPWLWRAAYIHCSDCLWQPHQYYTSQLHFVVGFASKETQFHLSKFVLTIHTYIHWESSHRTKLNSICPSLY